MSTLVFLEHHGGELQKGSLAVLSKAASLGGDVAGVIVGAGLDGFAEQAAAHGAATVYVADDPKLEAPLPQPRVDAIAQLVGEKGIETVLFAQSILASDIASGLAARLEAGLNWQLTDIVDGDGGLVGKQSALGDSVVVDVGWTSTPRIGLFRAGAFDPSEQPAAGTVEPFDVQLQEHSLAAEMVEQAHAEESGPSIEDADVIVAGGRGLGEPEKFALVEELAKVLGGAVAATRAVVDAGWYPYSAQVGQTGKSVVADALRRLRDLGRDPAQGRHAELEDDRRDQQGPERADLRVRRLRRRRRPAPDRAEADRGAAGPEVVTAGVMTSARPTTRLRSRRPTRSRRPPIRPTSGSRSAS